VTSGTVESCTSQMAEQATSNMANDYHSIVRESEKPDLIKLIDHKVRLSVGIGSIL